MRGSDLVAKALALAGTRYVFTLSGNHIMPLFDAAIDAKLSFIHVRHEAAAVHMADAWARLTGEVGIALLTGGPGHANGISALYTARMADAPLVLLSGHAPLDELGNGAFQEMKQAEIAAPLTKASWVVQSAANLGDDLARAISVAKSDRPGPVHLSLPLDILQTLIDYPLPAPEAFMPVPHSLEEAALREVVEVLSSADRPLVLAGPVMATARGQKLIAALSDATGVPAVAMDSPRGANDPRLGAFVEVLERADALVLIGKRLDYMLRFGRVLGPDCRVISLGSELDAMDAFRRLLDLSRQYDWSVAEWRRDVNACLGYRPPEWAAITSNNEGPVHPIELCRVLQGLISNQPDAVVIADGGEFSQWAQSMLSSRCQVINGPAGAIGPGVPFALAAKLAFPTSMVICLIGDGTCGYHMAEFDTATRYGLPFLAIVGNDARWNAEYQIQLRAYGPERAQGCELRPATRYDQVCQALGGHGEYVDKAKDLPAALERAIGSGRASCVNVRIESLPAPNVRRF
jgi:acetolactate synthase-1/2/3 large subunit